MTGARTGVVTPDTIAPVPGPVVFVSYSREDADWLVRFQTMLKPLARNRRIELWSDARVAPGREWRPELEDAIARADAALLLVSPDFLASDFIMEYELPELRKRGVPLAPVLLRPCLFADVAELADVQWAHDPVRDGPLRSAGDVEREIVAVCRAVMRLLDGRPRAVAAGDDAIGTDVQRRAATPRSPALVAGARSGAAHGVPGLPPGYVARVELAELRALLLGAGAGSLAITGGRALGLHGQGGIGKTVLAAALARDNDVLRHFPDGVYWVTVGERPDVVAAQIELLQRLGAGADDLRNTSDGRKRLRSMLEQRRCLVVVDDVWTSAAVEAFDVCGQGGRVLYTTRDPAVLRSVCADVCAITVLGEDVARELLARLAGTGVGELPAEVERVLLATGRVALALALVGAVVGRGGTGWPDVADALERAGATFLDHPYANTFKAIQVAVGSLDVRLRAAYESLAVYPEDTRIPIAAVERWWSHQHGFAAPQTRVLLKQLAAAKLLGLEEDGFAFHDLQREYLLLHADSVRLLHHDVREAYRKLLPSPQAPWRELPHDEPYIREHLFEHLLGAGDAEGAKRLATDLGYLALRAFRDGPHAAEADLRCAVSVSDDPAIGWSRRLLAQWGHLLSGHTRASDLAATLATRIGAIPMGIDASGLHAQLPRRMLAPRWGLFDAPDALQRVLEGHTDWVRAVTFSRDGRLLATAGDDHAIRIWDPATGSQEHVLLGHEGWVWTVAFSPDGRTLASGGEDGTIRLWDPATGGQTRVLTGHRNGVWAVVFSPDGATLASAGQDWAVRRWDARTGDELAILRGHGGPVRSLAFSPDGNLIASAGDDETVRLWNPTGPADFGVLEGHEGGVWAVAFSPGGQTIASAGTDGRIRLWKWNRATRRQTRAFDGHRGGALAVAFSPDGRSVASAGADWALRLWDRATGTPANVLEGHGGGVWALAFSPAGTLASAGVDRTVRLWDVASGTQESAAEGHSDAVWAVAFSPDGRTVASVGDDETLRLWDAENGTRILVCDGHGGGARSVAFSPDGRVLATAGYDATVRLWDAATGAQITVEAQGHAGVVRSVAFSPDGSILASAGQGRAVRLWNADSGVQIRALCGDADGYMGVAFAPDGCALAGAGVDGVVWIWDLEADGEPRGLEGHAGAVQAVAFSPDGRVLASAADDGTVRLWDLSTATETHVLEGHDGEVKAAAFLPDGRTLASGGADGTVRLWDPAEGTQTVSVRIGNAITSIATGDGVMAIGFDRDVACLRVLDAGEQPDAAAPGLGWS